VQPSAFFQSLIAVVGAAVGNAVKLQVSLVQQGSTSKAIPRVARNAQNSLYGMIRGGGGNRRVVWCPFVTKSKRVDITEGIGLNSIAPPPYSTI
jgi:hypothetical protein